MVYFGKVDLSSRANDGYEGTLSMYSGKKTTELSEDFILPDYLRDAKKIVWVRARAYLTDQFADKDAISYSGKTIYDILYIDEAGSAAGVSFESLFSGKIDGGEAAASGAVDYLVALSEGVSAHLCNPRKINLRSRSGVKANVFRNHSFLPAYSGAGVPECRVSSVPSAAVGVLRDDTLTFSADAVIDSSIPSPEAIVDIGANVSFFDDLRLSQGQAELAGKVDICALLLCRESALSANGVNDNDNNNEAEGENEGEKSSASIPVSVKYSYPVRLSLPASDLPSGIVCAGAFPSAINASLAEDERGEMRKLEFDMDYSLMLLALGKKETLFVDDAYTPGAYASIERRKFDLTSVAGHLSGSFSVSEGVDIPEENAKKFANADIVASDLRLSFPQESEITNDGAGAKLSGTASVDLLMRSSDGELFPYSAQIPIKTECSGVAITGGESGYELLGYANADIPKVRSSDGKIYFDFEVRYDLAVLANTAIDAVASIKSTKEIERCSDKFSGMIIAYPAQGETLFDVSRRYSLPCDALMSENGIHDASDELPRTLRVPVYSDKKAFSGII